MTNKTNSWPTTAPVVRPAVPLLKPVIQTLWQPNNPSPLRESSPRRPLSTPRNAAKRPQGPQRIIKDCLYGYVAVPPICAAFMDVPEFQRLRRIKQLGTASRVYPSATHTRFEHCIGTMHLAGRMAKQLGIKGHQRELIQLAGLYHDIGHLPYSHMFDKILGIIKAQIALSNPNNISLPQIHHEDRSLEIFTVVSARLKLLSAEDEQFVRACIVGSYDTFDPRKYMFQIVCSAIDVDKLDYLRRDAYHTGMPSFQADYIVANTRIGPNGHIAFRGKAREDIGSMFEVRRRMHELVYQHPVALQYDTLYTCMTLRAIDAGAITQFANLCDCQFETILMTSPATSATYLAIEARQKDHGAICGDPSHPISTKNIPDSGAIDDVRFVD